MNFEEAFKVANEAVYAKTRRHLKDREREVLEGSWHGKTYREIAENNGYSERYIKQDVGHQLWGLLSEALGEPVKKKSFKAALERWQSHNSAANPQPQESANPDFVGREDATADFTSEDDLNELVKRVRSRCYDKIQQQCGKMQLLNISQRVDLDDLYVDVNILKDIPRQLYRDVSQLAQEFDPSANDFNRFYLGKVPEKRVSGLEVVKNLCKVMVLGKPGSGKTTFLNHVAIKCNQGRLQADRVPIFIQLFRYAEDARDEGSMTLLDYIDRKFHFCGVNHPQASETLLKQGKCLILLDGLDEVPAVDSEKILRCIRQFCERYHNNSLVITCRTNAQEYSFKNLNFIEVEVADFDEVQIKKFSEKWFTAIAGNDQNVGEARAKKFIQELRLAENKRIRDLAVTPILLHLTCLFFRDREGNFPAIRSELYEEGLNILLSEWDDSRDIKRDEFYRNLSTEEKIDLLSNLAAALLEQDDYFPQKSKIQQMIAMYCELPKAAGKIILKSIEAQHGLLVERARGIYSFSHLTFQEYLTARNIVSSCKPDVLNYQALQNLARHITEKRWREVFLLAVEILPFPSTDCLLLLMKQQVDFLVATDERLQQFLSWVNQKSCIAILNDLQIPLPCPPCSDLKEDCYVRAAVRAFYFDIAFSLNRIIDNLNPNPLVSFFEDDLKLELAFTLGLNFTEEYYRNNDIYLDCELAYALGDAPTNADTKHFDIATELKHLLQQLEIKVLDNYHSQIFSLHYDEDSWQSKWRKEVKNLAEQLRVMLIKYRNIGHDWQFSEQQEKLLDQYYYANKLLAECLNSGCNVSPKVRSHIEDTLLLPIDEIEKRRLTE